MYPNVSSSSLSRKKSSRSARGGFSIPVMSGRQIRAPILVGKMSLREAKIAARLKAAYSLDADASRMRATLKLAELILRLEGWGQ